MDAYQKVALHLHGLSEVDRQWLLAQLPEQQSEALLAMLAELTALGIPQEPSLLTALETAVSEMPRGAEEKPPLCPAIQKLIAVDPGDVQALLAAESDAVIGIVLASYNWPWRDQVLARFRQPRRQSIIVAMETAPPVSDRARDALLTTLLTTLSTALATALRSQAEVTAPLTNATMNSTTNATMNATTVSSEGSSVSELFSEAPNERQKAVGFWHKFRKLSWQT